MKDIEKLLSEMDNYIEEHKDEIIEDLRTLVRIPSVREAKTNDFPFGKPCYDILKESLNLMEREGFTGRIAKGNEYVVASNGNEGKTIGIFSHGDVVSADGEWLFGKPFELTKKDGFLIGRGCNDDKSGIVEMLYAAKIIKELNIPLKNRLLLFVGGNEEDGMDDIKAYVRDEKMPDVCIVADAGYPYYKGEKSILRIMLESIDELENIERIEGGKSPNVVLETLNIYYKNKEKEIIKGISGLVSNPDSTKSALKIFSSDAKNNIKLSSNDKKILKSVCEILGNGYGEEIGIAYCDELFGKLTCGNGVVKTDNNKLLFSLDIRHSCNIDGNDILNKLEEKVKKIWNIKSYSITKGYLKNEDDKFCMAIDDSYRIVSKDNSGLKAEVVSGGTYSRFLDNSYSIGTVVYSLGGKMDAPDGHGQYHQPDESMSIKGFLEAIKVLVLIILKFDQLL